MYTVFGILGYSRREARAILKRLGFALAEVIGSAVFFGCVLAALNFAILVGF